MFYNKNSCKVFSIEIKIRGEVTLTESDLWLLLKIVSLKKHTFKGSWKWQENSKNSSYIWSCIKSFIFFSYFSQRYRWPVIRVKKTSHNKITFLTFICLNLNPDRKVIWPHSSMAVDKLTHWKLNCALPYQKSRGISKWENDNMNKSTQQKLNCASTYWKS